MQPLVSCGSVAVFHFLCAQSLSLCHVGAALNISVPGTQNLRFKLRASLRTYSSTLASADSDLQSPASIAEFCNSSEATASLSSVPSPLYTVFLSMTSRSGAFGPFSALWTLCRSSNRQCRQHMKFGDKARTSGKGSRNRHIRKDIKPNDFIKTSIYLLWNPFATELPIIFSPDTVHNCPEHIPQFLSQMASPYQTAQMCGMTGEWIPLTPIFKCTY